MKTKLPKLPHHKFNYHPLNNNDWMPQHCLPQNHDDYSFTPLQLSHSSSLSTSSSSSSSSGCNNSEGVSLPLPPSRLVRHSHIYPVPWSDAVTTTTNNNNDSKYDKNGGDPIVGGRASSPSSVAGFPPPFEFKRRRRRESEEGIGMRMEGLLTVCGGTDTSVVEGDGRMNEDSGVELFNQSCYHGGGREGNEKLYHRKELLQDKNSSEEDVSQLSSGMEFLTMITCGLLTTTTATASTTK